MLAQTLTLSLAALRAAGDDTGGLDPKDVVAGWLGLAVFVGLIAAVVLLAFSLVKHLRRAQAAQDAGVYDDPPQPRRENGAPAE